MSEKKVDIKSLLENNNINLNPETVTNKDLIENKKTDIDVSQVENANSQYGLPVEEEELLRTEEIWRLYVSLQGRKWRVLRCQRRNVVRIL